MTVSSERKGYSLRLEPGLNHAVWARFLLCLPRGTWIVRATRILGHGKYLLARRELKRMVLSMYRDYQQLSGDDTSPSVYAREFFALRPMLGVIPGLVPYLSERVFSELFVVRGWEHVESGIRNGKGVLLVSSHFGAMGCGSAFVSRKGMRALLLRDYRFQYLEGTRYARFFFHGGEPVFIGEPGRDSGASVLRRAYARLSGNGIVAFTPDAAYGDRSARVPFLGTTTELRTGLLSLSARTGSAVVPIFSWYESGKIHLEFFPPDYIREEAEAGLFLERYAAIYESLLRRHPAQLLWGGVERIIGPGESLNGVE